MKRNWPSEILALAHPLEFLPFVLILAAPCSAAWESVGKMVAKPPEGNLLRFVGRQYSAVITVLAPDLIQVRLGRGPTLGPDYSWAVMKNHWPQTPVEFGGDKLERIIRTPELELRLQLSPFRLAFYDRRGYLISKDADSLGAAWDGERVRCWKWMPPDEHYFGLGEKAGPLDKRGHTYVMWNTDPAGYDALTDPMYQSVPFFIGLRQGKAYGIFFDNTYRSSFDMGADSATAYSFGADGGELNYYFFYGPDSKKVLSRFTELIGRTSLPPRWSLGYVQSSVRYYPESTVRFVAENFRYRRIPCDAIFLDNIHMDENRVFTWDKARFPDPAKMLADLHAQGFHVIAITDPGVKVDDHYWVYQQGLKGNYFLKRKDGKLYTGIIWPGESAFPDFTSDKTHQWWGSLFEGLLKDGIDGFLTDMNEPTVDAVPLKQAWIPSPLDSDVVHYDHGLYSPDAKNHNIYGMLMSAATRDGLLRFHPNERPFVITRATYAGGQRYAAQWTGDNLATWEDLRASLRLILTMGMSGLVFTGSDAGGFIYAPSPELYARWMQAGVFHPYYWTHSGDPQRTVDPWSFGEAMEAINRRSIELRYRLLPYLYNAFYQATQTGLPIVRALALEYPDDPVVLDDTPVGQLNEFLFGNDLLVAPVVRAGETLRKVYLPRGAWFDFWSDRRYSGPITITSEAPLDTIPLFVRAGAIIPIQQVVEYTEAAPINPLTLEIYPDGSSSRDYYEDDGISFDYQHGVFLREHMAVSDGADAVDIKVADLEGTYRPSARSLILKVHAQPYAPRAVKLGGQTIVLISSLATLEKVDSGAAFDRETRTLWIKFPDRFAPFEVQVEKQAQTAER